MFASIALLLCTSLLHSFKAQECITATPLYLKMGTDAHLKVAAPPCLEKKSEFKWKFNYSVNIVRAFPDNTNDTIGNYKNRAALSVDYSLRLTNMQQVDKGHYSAWIIGDDDICLAKYSITVEDPVSSPELTAESVSHSSYLCVLAVNCSAQDSHIRGVLRCDTKRNCSLLEGETSMVTASGASLRMKVSNGSVICDHRNQVSELKATKEVQHVCSTKAVSYKTVAIVISVTVVGIFLFIGLFLNRRPAHRRQNCENTIYDTLQSNNPLQTKVDLNAIETVTGTPDIDSPETLYSRVDLSAKTKPPRSHTDK